MKYIYILFCLLTITLSTSSYASEIVGSITNNNNTVSNVITGSILNTTVNNINVTSDFPSVSISSGSTGILSMTVSPDVPNPSLDMSSLIIGNTGVLPVTVYVNSNTGVIPITLALPSGTRVTAATSSWDGYISLPKVSNSLTAPTAATGNSLTVTSAIEMGSSLFRLNFSNAVRIVFGGLANNYIGYMNGSTFVPITTSCAVDSQAWADTTLSAGGECYMSQGSNLIIWTKHFTTFGTYTQQSIVIPSSGGGGGGGGSYNYIPASSQKNNATTSQINTSTANTLNNKNSIGTLNNNSSSNLKVNSKVTFKKLLKKGDDNADVIELQKFLISKNFLIINLFPNNNPTGKFGPATEKALKAYQKSINLDQTGTMGPKTREAINSENVKFSVNTTSSDANSIIPYSIDSNNINKNSTTTNTVNNNNSSSTLKVNNSFTFKKLIKRGDDNTDVIELQKFLVSKNFLMINLFPNNNPTGKFGTATEKALKAYQRSINLDQTGTMGPKTREAINKERVTTN